MNKPRSVTWLIRLGAWLGRASLASAIALALLYVPHGHAQSPVPQRGYDANVSGATLVETTLNTTNVAPSTFGLVFKIPVDDTIYAQALYVPNVVINQVTHNVLYIATMSDTLYAFDADIGGAPLWTVNLARLVGATPVPIANFVFSGNLNIVGNLGILSTPVIDLSTNTIYAVACTLENSTVVYRLHAVDITTGTPRTGSGVKISGSYGGSTFDGRYLLQRVSLALADNQVVFGFSAIELEYANGYVGWVMAYDKTTLAQSGVFATVTTGNRGGGVWQSGRPPVVDSAGYVYVFTGNGYGGGYDGVKNFSETVLKLDPTQGLKLVDWFTPSNWAYLDVNDLDLTSSGPMLIPGTSLLAGGGKTGDLFVLNTANLGKTNAPVQQLHISESEIKGGPVYWQRSTANGGPLMYNWGIGDRVKAFAFNGTTFAGTPSSQGSITNQIYPGGILTLSANGDTPGSGVLWATVSASGDAENNPPVSGILYAFNAGNVATQLWNSTMNGTRDDFGNFAKFVPPLVANGRVYVPTWSNQVAVYGLLTGVASAPTFTPPPGIYTSAQSVSLTSSTFGASIYYTTDGTVPSVTPSELYTGPIPVGSSLTIQAIAVANGFSTSPVASGTYTIDSSTGTLPVSLVSSANVDAIGSDGLAPQSGGLDGKGYALSAAVLGSSLSWNGKTYSFGSAGVADAVSNTTVPLPSGNYTTLSLLGMAVNGNQPNQTFTVNYSDGTSTSYVQNVSDWWTSQGYAGESKVLTMSHVVTPNGSPQSGVFTVYGYSFALNPAKVAVSLTLPKTRNVVVLAVDVSGTESTAAPTFTPRPGFYNSAQSVSLVSSTSGASIYYTTDGTVPSVTPSELYSGPIPVSSSLTIRAIAVASGYSASQVASGTYTLYSGTGALPVNLVSSANVDAIWSDGSAPQSGGLDGENYALSAAVLGSSLSWNGNTYSFGSAGVADAVSNTTVPLPSGNFTTLSLLGIAVNGNQPNQTFTVNYSDGTSTSYVQSVSDWWSSQGYAGESKVLTMSHIVTPNGSSQSGVFTVYGYSFALNSAKVAVSLTLPKTRNVVVLAVDISSTAAAPTFTPRPGFYTSAQSVSLASSTSGASIYYTTDGTVPSVTPSELYSGPIPVSSSLTIRAIAVASGYSTSPVASGTYTIGTGALPVSLVSSANVDAIWSDGSAPQNGGLDGENYACSAAVLGSSLSWNGNTYSFGSVGVADAVSNTTVPLPSGNFTTLSLLGMGVNGNQPNQTFTVNYSDGTSTSYVQSVSDWWTSQGYAGESKVLTMSHIVTPNGSSLSGVFTVYGYSFALNSAKTAVSLTLPKTRNVVVLAVDVH